MRLKLGAALLAGVAAFTVAACNNPESNVAPDQPASPVKIELDFDGKTKTVTAPPPTLPTYRPATPTMKRATTPARATTVATKPRSTR